MDDTLRVLADLAKRKRAIDIERNYGGSSFYLDELKTELREVEEELKTNNQAHLEVELGDVLWDYVLVLVNLEAEKKISLQKVFSRAKQKYDERISGIEQGLLWADIKEEQKNRLRKEDGL